jgi:hypothetical protein
MGQLIELGKPPLDRAPRAPHDLSHILHATVPQLPGLHGGKPAPFFFGEGCIKIPHVLFNRRIPCLRKDKAHHQPPEKSPLLEQIDKTLF